MNIENPVYQKELALISADIKDFNCLKNKTIAITGATGMIGRQIVDTLYFLNKNYQSNIKIIATGRKIAKLQQVFAAYLADINFIETDLLTPFSSSLKIDYIIHCASFTQPSLFAATPVNVILDNISAAKNLLNYCVEQQVSRLVYLSSVEAYGQPFADQTIFSEDDNGLIKSTNVRNNYPQTKRIIENLCCCYNAQYNLNTLIVRPAKTYGITWAQDDKRAMAEFATAAINNNDIHLKSDGKQRFSFVYNADVVSGIFFALEYGAKSAVYNIADSQSIATIKEVAEMFLANKKAKVIVDNDLDASMGYSLVGHTIVANEKLKALGWQAKFDLQSGINQILQFNQ